MLILLVDDDNDDYDLFCEALTSVYPNAKCLYAFNGREALKQLEALTVLPNYIILDVIMPVLDGEELIKKVKASTRLKDIPIIIYTSASHLIDIESLKKSGAKDCVLKPIEFSDLVQKLREIII